MKKILAVSGGIDSMVLLDIYKNEPGVVVAHFNHGTRPSADDDQKFVEQKCQELGVPFFTDKFNLGANVSEETARTARYDFFKKVAQKIAPLPSEVQIYTAHHLDDLTESIAINLLRGTGWRGLTPFSASHVVRPFLDFDDILLPKSKADIISYAAVHKIIFRQDPTNVEDKYLRNRIREKLQTMPAEEKFNLEEKIYQLYKSQQKLRQEITQLEQEIIPKDHTFNRQDFKNMDDSVALELLKTLTKETEPVCKRFLNAIRTYSPEKSFNLSKDHLVTIHKNYFKL